MTSHEISDLECPKLIKSISKAITSDWNEWQSSPMSAGDRGQTLIGRDQVRITTLDDPRMIKAFYCSMINSTSKMRVALGGIGPCPRGPYLESALVNFGMVQ